MELMLVAMNYKIVVKHSEKKKSHEIQMCLSLKGIANHLGQKVTMHKSLWTSNGDFIYKPAFSHVGVNQHRLRCWEPQKVQPK
jgi:hypothetical protein